MFKPPQAEARQGAVSPADSPVPENGVSAESKSQNAIALPRHHRVVRGETLTSIAKQYACSLSQLLEVNEQCRKNPDRIHPGQILTLPSSAVGVQASPRQELVQSRGIRLHNPGNIRHSAANAWQGLAALPCDADGYCRFLSPEFGVRAMCRILASYQERGVCSLEDTIRTWAPASDNNPTAAYISFVSKKSGIAANAQIDLANHREIKALLSAMIEFENGTLPYHESIIDKGIILSGLGTKATK